MQIVYEPISVRKPYAINILTSLKVSGIVLRTMLKMRLQRIGRRNDASYRLIVTDSRRGPKSGKHIDLLGSYNPKLDQFNINGDRAREWIQKGVQVSDTVHNLLVSGKVIEGKKINVLPRKSPIVDEAALKAKEEEEAAQATEEAEGEMPLVETVEETKTPESPEEAVASPEDTKIEESSEPKEEKKAE
jgi:small subunit ribosomal protein S16